jgi:HEPN domain-containing protein
MVPAGGLRHGPLADAMFASGRYFYAVFMCHLSLEKALKGLIAKRLDELLPKTHNLLYLLNMLALQRLLIWNDSSSD